MWWYTAAALAADPTVGGVVRPEVAIDLPGSKQRLAGEFAFETNTFARAFARGESKGGDAWFFELRLQHHLWVPNDFKGDLDFAATEAWWDLGVGETGWDGRVAGPVRLRIGALIERWGRLDLLPVADIVNPRDGRTGLLTPAEQQRIPIPMATVAAGGDTFRSETTIIPFSTADLLWLRETDWAYIRQGWLDDYVSDMQLWPDADGNNPSSEWSTLFNNVRGSLDAVSPSMRRGLDRTVNGKGIPEALVANGEIAQRFEIRARNLDLGVMGGVLRSRQPVTALDPFLRDLIRSARSVPVDITFQNQLQSAMVGGPLDVSWPRTIVGGADASMLAGPVQLRGEAMFQSARVVRLPYASAEARPNLGAGLGVDYLRGSSFQVTLEARWLHLFDPPERMVFSVPDQIQVAGGVRWSVARDRLTMQLGGAWDLSFQEILARPTVGYRVSDAVALELGALILGGFATPPPDGLAEALAYEGGPLSYWSRNDAITAAVTLVR